MNERVIQASNIQSQFIFVKTKNSLREWSKGREKIKKEKELEELIGLRKKVEKEERKRERQREKEREKERESERERERQNQIETK